MDPNYRNNIAPSLREARRSGGLSQEELAARLSLSVKTVRNYEAGSSVPPSDLSAAWCAACGYSFRLYLSHVYDLYTSDFDQDADYRTLLAFLDTATPEQLHLLAELSRHMV